MSTHVPHRGLRKAVMDTGPLVDALILEMARRSPESRRKPILENSKLSPYLAQSINRQDAFKRLFLAIRTILTTPHVIAEVQGHVKGPFQRASWSFGMEMLNTGAVDERSVPRLSEMHQIVELRASVCEIGPTDTCLIELARQEGCTLLTNDRRTLARRAWELGVDCRLVSDLVS